MGNAATRRSDARRRRRSQACARPASQPPGFERLERRELLAITVARTTLNLRFSTDLKPNEAAYGEYQSFKITNTGPTALTNVWVKATNFSPTQKVQLGSGEDGLYFLGDLAVGAGDSETAFIYMVAEQITSPPALDPQNFTIQVWQGRPGAAGATLIATQDDLFQWVGEAVEDDSSSRTASVNVQYAFGGVPTAGPIVGGTMTMTVTGDIKNKPDRILFSPASTLAWPADAFVLEDAVVTYSKNPQLPPDIIFEKPIASKPKDFTAVYSFRIADATPAPTPVTPVLYTAKGVQDLQSRKFDHSQILEGVADIPPAVFGTDLQITKIGATTVVPGTGTQYSYTITVSSTGTHASQGVVVADTWPAAFTRLPITPPPGTSVTNTPTGFTWTIGTLAAGTTTQLTVNFTVPAATPLGPYTNTAVVTSTTPDPGPNTAQITTTVVPAPVYADLEIEKRDFVQAYTPGLPLQWRITVTNRGPSAVTGARVQDVFPPQVSGTTWTALFSNGSGTASGSGTTIDQQINLGVGGTAVYTVNATTGSTATGALVNTATVSSPTGLIDPNLANNAWTDTDLFAPVADLAITKTDAGTNYVPGEITTYTITVTNNGPSFVAGATVIDTFSTAFTGVGWTATFAGEGSSGATAGSGNIAQTINLAAGGTATYTVTARVSPAATVSIVNTATVAAPLGTSDPNPANNSATDTNTAAPRVFLAVTKTDDKATYVPGQITTYTVVVTNSGPSFLTGGRLVDVFPASIVGPTWTASYIDAGSGGDTSGSGNINATFNLAPGGIATFTITAPVASTATGDLVNTATVLVPVGTTNTNPVNSATDTDTPAPLADLRAAKSDGSSTYVPGTTTTYTITISNFGPSAVRGARVVDTFDPTRFNVAGIVWTATLQGGSTISGTGTIDVLLDLARGNAESVVVFTVTAPILAGATGNLTNTVTVQPPTGTTDPNPANNTAIDVDVQAGSPERFADLAVEKRDFVQQYAPGETLTWTITVTNAGPNAVTGARVYDAFPVQVGGTTWTAVFTGGSGTESGSGTVIDQLVNLDPGGRAVYTVIAKTLSTATGTLTNTVTVTAPADVTDPNLANNSWTDVDQYAPVADLAVTKDDPSPTYVPGQATTYTVTVTNNGPTAVTGARVVDTFASSFTAVSWSAAFTAGSSGTASGDGDIDELVTLAAGGVATYTIVATVSPWATVDIVNTVTVTAPEGTRDPNLANNSATHTNTAAPRVFLAIAKTDNTGTYVPGETLTYSITVTNTGPSALIGGTLVDDLPASIVGATWTATFSGSGSTGPANGSGDINATGIALAVGGTATFTVTAPVASTATEPLVNTATIRVPLGTTNTNPVNSATDTDAPTPIADLRAFKTDNTATYQPGTTTTYSITISNFGPSAAFGARVTDTFDPAMFDVANIRWTAVLPGGGTRSGTGNINELFDLDRGNAERVIVFTVAAPIRATATGPLSNTARVAPPAGTTDYNLTNNASTDVDIEAPRNGLVTGTDDGCPSAPMVRVIDPGTGATFAQFVAYEAAFRGGVRVATGDLNADGYDEIITAPGRGRAGEVRVWTQAGALLPTYTLFPFGRTYTGGVEVATGDFNGDGRIDIVAGMSASTGTVRVFLVNPAALDPVVDLPWRSFVPFPGRYTGGVNLAAGNFGTFVNGRKTSSLPDSADEVVVGSNAGMVATVAIYDLSVPPRVVGSFQPIARGFTGGVSLSIGRWNSDTIADILVGAGIGGRSVVDVYSGSDFRQLDRLRAFSTFAKPNAKVYATSLDTNADGIIDRVFAVQGQQGIAGTTGVTAWLRSSGVKSVLAGTAGFIPPLRLTNMTKRRL